MGEGMKIKTPRNAYNIRKRHFEQLNYLPLTFYIDSLDDLEAMKRVVSRPIDLADIVLIQEKRNLMRHRGKKSSAK